MQGKLMKGNEALAEGAIRGGCRFYAGYPITPQSEVLEYMAWRQKEVGGEFIQGESEVASINMVFGAAAAGARAMTSSSGCGYSLKQEGISYITGACLPAVFVNVMRYGIGGGSIHQGQDAYWQVVKGGGHGDYRHIVLAPNSVQESADMAFEAFALAEKYRQPVVILSDGTIGQMVEPVVLPDFVEHSIDAYDWSVKGDGNDNLPDSKAKSITDLFFNDVDYHKGFVQRMRHIMDVEQDWEEVNIENADLIFVAFGISSRIAHEAINLSKEQGLNLGLIRPKRLWPFPRKAFAKVGSNCKAFVTIEMNSMSQMLEDVMQACKFKTPCYSYASARIVPDAEYAVQFAKDILAGKVKEEEVF